MSIFENLLSPAFDQGEPELLTEAIRTEIAPDVDHIYKTFFRDDVYRIQNSKPHGAGRRYIIRANMVDKAKVFKTDYMKNIHRMNPMDIMINGGTNYYNSIEGVVSLSLSGPALKALAGRTLDKFIEDHPYYASRIRQDLSPNRIKESIYHELAHYVDDTVNNHHLTNMKMKILGATDEGNPNKAWRIKNRGEKHTYLTDFEMEAMTHSIYQVYRQNHKIWDRLTFEEMLQKSPSMWKLYKEFLDSPDRSLIADFKKKMRKRLHREGLLGRRM